MILLSLLLQGNNMAEDHGGRTKNEPRRSWMMRKRQERAAMKEGLAEWQANPYFCAGRVTVPALMDTVACQCFINTSAPSNLVKGVLWMLQDALMACQCFMDVSAPLIFFVVLCGCCGMPSLTMWHAGIPATCRFLLL